MYGVEAAALYRSIGAERHEETIALCYDSVRSRPGRAAVAANQRRRSVVTVEYLHTVVGAFQVSLELEVIERLAAHRQAVVTRKQM